MSSRHQTHIFNDHLTSENTNNNSALLKSFIFCIVVWSKSLNSKNDCCKQKHTHTPCSVCLYAYTKCGMVTCTQYCLKWWASVCVCMCPWMCVWHMCTSYTNTTYVHIHITSVCMMSVFAWLPPYNANVPHKWPKKAILDFTNAIFSVDTIDTESQPIQYGRSHYKIYSM